MPFLDILKDKYIDETKDHTIALISHRNFGLVLSEAYECKILSNPWLAASTASKPTHTMPEVIVSPSLESVHSKAAEQNEGLVHKQNSVTGHNVATTCDSTDKHSLITQEVGNIAKAILVDMDNKREEDMDESVVAPGRIEGQHHDKTSATQSPVSAIQPLLVVKENMGNSSDATFGMELRETFFEAAKAIRHYHGVQVIIEPGENPQLDYLVNEVMLTYQRLKVHLLKTSNQEAQFRLDLESKMSRGIWNQYDIKEMTSDSTNSFSSQGQASRDRNTSDPDDFVVYARAKEHPKQQEDDLHGQFSVRNGASYKGQTAVTSSPMSHRGQVLQQQYEEQVRRHREGQAYEESGLEGSRESIGGGGQKRASVQEGRLRQPITFQSQSKGMDGGGGGSFKGKPSQSNHKRTTSGKFEKNQVLPLTEWLLKHSTNPYPTMEDKADLARESGLTTQQVQNWFINMRKRHWTPMMNGKRRPRTFLDYVILSSQQGGQNSDGPQPGHHAMSNAAGMASHQYGRGHKNQPLNNELHMSNEYESFDPQTVDKAGETSIVDMRYSGGEADMSHGEFQSNPQNYNTENLNNTMNANLGIEDFEEW